MYKYVYIYVYIYICIYVHIQVCTQYDVLNVYTYNIHTMWLRAGLCQKSTEFHVALRYAYIYIHIYISLSRVSFGATL
jgi:hypothetical protein